MPTVLPNNYKPNKNDAIFGRGGKHNNLRSGSVFRSSICKQWPAYCAIEATDYAAKRSFIKEYLVDSIVKKNGRFLFTTSKAAEDIWSELDPNDKQDYNHILKKIAQSLRDEKKKYSPSDFTSTMVSSASGNDSPGGTHSRPGNEKSKTSKDPAKTVKKVKAGITKIKRRNTAEYISTFPSNLTATDASSPLTLSPAPAKNFKMSRRNAMLLPPRNTEEMTMPTLKSLMMNSRIFESTVPWATFPAVISPPGSRRTSVHNIDHDSSLTDLKHQDDIDLLPVPDLMSIPSGLLCDFEAHWDDLDFEWVPMDCSNGKDVSDADDTNLTGEPDLSKDLEDDDMDHLLIQEQEIMEALAATHPVTPSVPINHLIEESPSAFIFFA